MEIRRAVFSDIPMVAFACNYLHNLEGGHDLAVGATPKRAHDHLIALIAKGQASVFVAVEGSIFHGCIICQYDEQKPEVVFVGGLYCEAAPYKTALRLMWAATRDAQQRRTLKMYIAAGTKKNEKRSTYERLGFRLNGQMNGGSWIMRASVKRVEAGLAARLGIGLGGQVDGINH